MANAVASGAYSLGAVTVAEAMHSGVVVCTAETPLHAVASAMSRYGIHAVVVEPAAMAARGTRVWGVLSAADLIAAGANHSGGHVTAAQLAQTPLVTLRPEDTLARACVLMKEFRTTHALVVAPDSDRPIGVISTLDVARALAVEARA
jgi:CBS domain-containing protein